MRSIKDIRSIGGTRSIRLGMLVLLGFLGYGLLGLNLKDCTTHPLQCWFHALILGLLDSLGVEIVPKDFIVILLHHVVVVVFVFDRRIEVFRFLRASYCTFNLVGTGVRAIRY